MFSDLESLLRRFTQLGAVRAFCKPLAENDNSKQQIYLGGNLEAVQMFPFETIEAEPNVQASRSSTYKAKLNFSWIDEGIAEQAKGAQLILYPQYPEVRLSGFLRGCKLAPSEQMRHIQAGQRRFNNGPDGRILFFGITRDGQTLAYLAPAGTAIAQEFSQLQSNGNLKRVSVFFDLPLLGRDSKSILLERLAEIREFGWHSSIRLRKV